MNIFDPWNLGDPIRRLDGLNFCWSDGRMFVWILLLDGPLCIEDDSCGTNRRISCLTGGILSDSTL